MTPALPFQTAKQLAPATLRKLVQDPDMEAERLSMFAYLLGACGNDDDAELLHSMLKNPAQRYYKAFEGILAGYITMRPKEGWAFTQEMLKNDKQSFLLRYATMRTTRFFYNAKPEETGPLVMQGMSLAIAHADLSDVVQQRAELHVQNARRRESHFRREPPRPRRYAFAVLDRLVLPHGEHPDDAVRQTKCVLGQGLFIFTGSSGGQLP